MGSGPAPFYAWPMPPATRAQLRAEFRELGVRPGAAVMMHSSLSALGPVDGGVATVVDALLDSVGAGGTLLVPAFRDSVWGDPAEFTNSDCDCTSADGLCPSRQPGFQGVIPEEVRRRPGSLRSCHKTHSWVGLGARARDLLAGHRAAPSSCGPGNPFESLRDDDLVLTLGVGVDRVTLWHFYEEVWLLPYAGHLWPAERHLNNTVPGLRLQYEHPGVLQDLCRAAGILATAPVGKSTSGLMSVGRFRRFMAAALADDPFCLVLRPPDRRDGDLAVDALHKAAGMLRAWRRTDHEAPLARPAIGEHPLAPVPIPDAVAAGAGDLTVREDCPAFAGYHAAGDARVPLCRANGRHPDLFRRGGAFDRHGVTTCETCSWHARFPPLPSGG